jgi:hypothetical protein
VYREFLLVSVLGARFSGMRLDLLHLFWEDGIAFRGGVASIDVEPQTRKNPVKKCRIETTDRSDHNIENIFHASWSSQHT